MEGIYVGKVKRSVINKDNVNLLFVDHRQDIHHLSDVIDYEDTAYCLVPTNDIIINNDEMLKLREQVSKLEKELMEIKTTRTLREAYITGVEKGCESLKEDRDLWKLRWNSVVTDIAKSLEANGIEFTLKEVHGNGNWDVVIDIPELNEAKKKVEDLETKLKAAKSNETFWRDRKEEEEDYHHYWLHTFDRAVEQAADKGIHIDVRGTDEDCNAGVVVIDNVKAEELKSQVVQMEDANQKLRQRISTADEEIEELKSQYTSRPATGWRNTYYSAVEKAKAEGVTIVLQDWDLKANVAHLEVMNYRAKNLETAFTAIQSERESLDIQNGSLKEAVDSLKNKIKRLEDDNSAKAEALIGAKDRGDYWIQEHQKLKVKHNAKWSAMTEALKAKGVEVIYMGEENEKPIIDVKIPKLDALKRKADEINTRHINCLCKNYFDAESISHGTIPKCSSCAHYMHTPSRFTHDWCYMPVPNKEGGAGYIRKLNKEEAEGPACADFKARKE